MNRVTLLLITAGLMAGLTGCAIMDGDTTGSGSASDDLAIMQQPVFVEPIFVLEGLDALPEGLSLNQLHLGVGALFLEVMDNDSGIAYANRTPFQLHFEIVDGVHVAHAPPLTLPHGGHFQVSVQLEPQMLVSTATPGGVANLGGTPAESSLVVSGAVTQTGIEANSDGTVDDPEPLPWMGDPESDAEEAGQAISGLRRTIRYIPFTFSSARTVRFTVDQVQLTGGSSNQMMMTLQVGNWVEETIKPALISALGDIADAELSDDGSVEDIDLTDLVEHVGGGMDGLIGGIAVEVK